MLKRQPHISYLKQWKNLFIGYLLIVICFNTNLYAQKNKSGYLYYRDAGNYYYALNQYDVAKEFFYRAIELKNDDPDVNFKLGYCYLQFHPKTQALNYLLKAYASNPRISQDIQLYIAQAYHFNALFDSAIISYQQYLANNTLRIDNQMLNKINKYIIECNYGIELEINNDIQLIENIGNHVNSSYKDYRPLIIDSLNIYYSSIRPDIAGKTAQQQKPIFTESIYKAQLDKPTFKSRRFTTISNSYSPRSVVGICSNHTKVLFYSDLNNGDLFITNYNNGQFRNPEWLPSYINTPYEETSASYGFNNKWLFFTSSNPINNLGGKDIFYCILDSLGKWSHPINIGNKINTIFDEEGVFFDNETNILYFSSTGHQSIGGYDIFYSIYDTVTNHWGEVKSMGKPVNTPFDDLHFFKQKNTDYAYYSSVHNTCEGDQDIYRISFLSKPEIPVILAKEEVEEIINPAVNVKISIKNISTDQNINIISDAKNNIYKLTLPKDNYKINIEVNEDNIKNK
jgi:tetratricopeptide (TPR) repeat protein